MTVLNSIRDVLQNSKTTFVTVNQQIVSKIVFSWINSKTTFVTVNPEQLCKALAEYFAFKNNFCYC